MRKPLFSCFFRLVALVVVLQLFTTPIAFAKPLTPDIVREKIQRRGRHARVWLRENNGIILHGRVNIIGRDSFRMQLWNDPQLVEVRYDEVAELHQGLSTSGSLAIVAIGVGATAGLAIYGIHELHSTEDKGLPTPSLPAPAFR